MSQHPISSPTYRADLGPKMVGSMHIYSDGYGYGARVPTARNLPTLPRNVPQFRHPPDDEDFVRGTKPKSVILHSQEGAKRHQEQVLHQTSGEYGNFLLDPNTIPQPVSAVKKRYIRTDLDKGIVKRQEPIYDNYREFENFPTSFLNEDQTNTVTSKVDSGNSSNNSPQQQDQKSILRSTLQSLDPSFNRFNKRDLIAATSQQYPDQKLQLAVISNYRGSQSSVSWRKTLRKDQN